jgi:hypothetical protein
MEDVVEAEPGALQDGADIVHRLPSLRLQAVRQGAVGAHADLPRQIEDVLDPHRR